jgi:hypothetical protein
MLIFVPIEVYRSLFWEPCGLYSPKNRNTFWPIIWSLPWALASSGKEDRTYYQKEQILIDGTSQTPKGFQGWYKTVLTYLHRLHSLRQHPLGSFIAHLFPSPFLIPFLLFYPLHPAHPTHMYHVPSHTYVPCAILPLSFWKERLLTPSRLKGQNELYHSWGCSTHYTNNFFLLIYFIILQFLGIFLLKSPLPITAKSNEKDKEPLPWCSSG